MVTPLFHTVAVEFEGRVDVCFSVVACVVACSITVHLAMWIVGLGNWLHNSQVAYNEKNLNIRNGDLTITAQNTKRNPRLDDFIDCHW